jgi:hypothetical protein
MTQRKINEVIEAFCTKQNMRPSWIYRAWVVPLGPAGVHRMTWNNWTQGRLSTQPKSKRFAGMIKAALDLYPTGDWRHDLACELRGEDNV